MFIDVHIFKTVCLSGGLKDHYIHIIDFELIYFVHIVVNSENANGVLYQDHDVLQETILERFR